LLILSITSSYAVLGGGIVTVEGKDLNGTDSQVPSLLLECGHHLPLVPRQKWVFVNDDTGDQGKAGKGREPTGRKEKKDG
jgi:hypothetical protein